MPTNNLEKMIQQKEVLGENTNGLNRALLQNYFKADDVQRYEELCKKLSNTDFVLSSGLHAQLIELHCNNDGVDKALTVHAELKSKQPDFVLDDLKTVKIVSGLVTNDRIDEAIEFLQSNKRAEKSKDERSIQYNNKCWSILNALAEKGRDADVTKLFNALDETNFIEVNNVLLGPLVKVHLVNDDITKALEAFQTVSTKYKCTPLKNELSSKLIQMEDATRLQLVTDLGTDVHGEVNCLYDLALTFIECGRIRQARKILETPGLSSRAQRVTDACSRYNREGKTAVLEGILKATKDLNNFDRSAIYYNTLLSYCKEDSTEKALDLWTQIQEEGDVVPTDQFLTTLARFLEEKGVEVPFAVPVSETPVKSNRHKNAISNNRDKNQAATKTNNTTKRNVTNETAKLETMLQQNQLHAATQHIMKMLEANTHPLPRTFRFYLNKIAQAGDYDTFKKISPLVPSEIKEQVSFHNRWGNAYTAAGKLELFVGQVIEDFDNAATEEELKELEKAFPKGTMCGILKDHPELLSKYEKFAHNVAERGFFAPINILWMNYIENGNYIMKNYLREQPRILFNSSLRSARDSKDETSVLYMLKSLADSKISEGGLGAVHSALIDVYCLQEKYDEALNAVNSAIKNVSLESINRTALTRVKNGLEAAGKKFPHTIPDKKKAAAADDSSSSSSSSDDEAPVKK